VTANRVAIFDANYFLTNSVVTDTELGYLGGVTGSIVTNFDARAATIFVNAADLALTNSAVSVISKFATNVAWNINVARGGTVNAITNTLGGTTANLWLTNVVDGGWFVARILADGTSRTVSITNASALTLNVINTNGFSSVGTIPQIPITASKLAIICGRAWVIAATTNVDLWSSVQQ